ncbi:MAG: hypothetical protein EON58_23415 [Alphaproteobacteria bacterium]|nr:MAG: hypothetical protein EON58_23415 [Alphaproteobacteria bacterium]
MAPDDPEAHSFFRESLALQHMVRPIEETPLPVSDTSYVLRSGQSMVWFEQVGNTPVYRFKGPEGSDPNAISWIYIYDATATRNLLFPGTQFEISELGHSFAKITNAIPSETEAKRLAKVVGARAVSKEIAHNCVPLWIDTSDERVVYTEVQPHWQQVTV